MSTRCCRGLFTLDPPVLPPVLPDPPPPLPLVPSVPPVRSHDFITLTLSSLFFNVKDKKKY